VQALVWKVTYAPWALPERTFSARELLCIMYARLEEDRAGGGYRGGSLARRENGGKAEPIRCETNLKRF
jgi:hypothetical protein